MTDADATVPLHRLTTVHGTFAARVLQARLADEGIDARLRGPLDSPYRFTVGDLARIDVMVAADEMDDAAYVLLVNDVEDATELPEPPLHRRVRWPAVALVLALVTAAVSPVVHYATG